MRKRHYTMLELMTAMAVLLIFMLALMRFFTDSQTLMARAGDKTEQYERARIAMDMIAADLQSLYYVEDSSRVSMSDEKETITDDAGGSVDAGVKKFTLAVQRSNIPDGATSAVVQVTYYWDRVKQVLKVLEISNKDGSGWVPGNLETASASFVSVDSGDCGELIPGVAAFNVVPKGTGTNWVIPDSVEIEMTLLDAESMTTIANMTKSGIDIPDTVEEEKNKRSRTFKRTIQIEH